VNHVVGMLQFCVIHAEVFELLMTNTNA